MTCYSPLSCDILIPCSLLSPSQYSPGLALSLSHRPLTADKKLTQIIRGHSLPGAEEKTDSSQKSFHLSLNIHKYLWMVQSAVKRCVTVFRKGRPHSPKLWALLHMWPRRLWPCVAPRVLITPGLAPEPESGSGDTGESWGHPAPGSQSEASIGACWPIRGQSCVKWCASANQRRRSRQYLISILQ